MAAPKCGGTAVSSMSAFSGGPYRSASNDRRRRRRGVLAPTTARRARRASRRPNRLLRGCWSRGPRAILVALVRSRRVCVPLPRVRPGCGCFQRCGSGGLDLNASIIEMPADGPETAVSVVGVVPCRGTQDACVGLAHPRFLGSSTNYSREIHNSFEFMCMEEDEQTAWGIEKRGRSDPPGVG